MKLISCSYCGVVIDTDRIIEPSVYDHDTGDILDEGSFDSDSGEYKPSMECPACDRTIFYHNGKKTI